MDLDALPPLPSGFEWRPLAAGLVSVRCSEAPGLDVALLATPTRSRCIATIANYRPHVLRRRGRDARRASLWIAGWVILNGERIRAELANPSLNQPMGA